MKSGRFAIIPARAIDDRRLNPAAVLVLATLGTYGDRDGWCFPSLSTVAKRLGVSKQAVSKQIQSLVELGYLEVEARKREDGGQSSNGYRIVHDRDLDIAPRQTEVDGGQRHVDGGQRHVDGGQRQIDAPSTSEVDPYRTSQSNEKKNMRSAERDRDFEAWYGEYPRKKARGDAEKAYSKAKARFGADALLEGLRRWKASYRGEAQFIPYPATWLNDQRWLDEADGTKATAPPSADSDRSVWAAKLSGFRRNGFWKADWGPRPGDPKCRVPRDLLDEMAA